MATDFADVIERAIESRIRDIFTASVGEVVSYDPAARKADVRPGVTRWSPREDGTIDRDLEVPILPAVPVLLLRTQGARIVVDIEPGTKGLLLFFDVPIHGWMQSGDVTGSEDLRMHHPTSAVFIPGLYPDTESLDVATEPDTMILDADTIKLGATASFHVAIAEAVRGELDKIAAALNSANAPNGGGPVTYGSAYVPADVNSTRVKVVP